jgi:hypothetical protein
MTWTLILLSFERIFPFESGAVAQLGERLPCKQEVIGSIPFSSTIRKQPRGVSLFIFASQMEKIDGC